MQTEVNRPLRVAFVDYVLDPDKPGRSGLSDVVWDMASELVNQGHEAHVIASYYTDQYPDRRVHVHNFPSPPIGYRNLIGHFWILKRAADIAKRLQPDIIHAPEYPALSEAGIPSLANRQQRPRLEYLCEYPKSALPERNPGQLTSAKPVISFTV